MRKIIFLCIIPLCLCGCGDMLSAMSGMNQELGGTCTRYDAYYYVDSEGKWLEGKYIGTTRDGKNVREEEKRWIADQANYYLRRRAFQNYYVTSPYSGADYKINIHCGQWY